MRMVEVLPQTELIRWEKSDLEATASAYETPLLFLSFEVLLFSRRRNATL
jgi:hypothetical protein